MKQALNLGCGSDIRTSDGETTWTNVDLWAPKADLAFDLFRFPWPTHLVKLFYYDHVLAQDIVEHIPHTVFTIDDRPCAKDGFFLFFEELWRCLKPGGTVELRFPSFNSLNNWRDPTHTRRILRENFELFFTPGLRDYQTHARFEIVSWTERDDENVVAILRKV